MCKSSCTRALIIDKKLLVTHFCRLCRWQRRVLFVVAPCRIKIGVFLILQEIVFVTLLFLLRVVLNFHPLWNSWKNASQYKKSMNSLCTEIVCSDLRILQKYFLFNFNISLRSDREFLLRFLFKLPIKVSFLKPLVTCEQLIAFNLHRSGEVWSGARRCQLSSIDVLHIWSFTLRSSNCVIRANSIRSVLASSFLF